VRKALSVLLAVAGIALLPASLRAQVENWDGQLHQGDLTFELGFGFGAHGNGFGYGIAAAPGVDWIVADWRLGEVVPLALGIGAKGAVEYIPAGGVGAGADALATIHLGFRGLEASRFIQALDVYTAAGAGLVFVGEASVPFGLVFPAIYAGAAWFLRENFALYLEGVYRKGWRAVGYGGATFGIRLRRTPG
jgi:hypothetical protein